MGSDQRYRPSPRFAEFLSRLRALGYEAVQEKSGGFALSQRGRRRGEVWTDGKFARLALTGRNGRPRVTFAILLTAALPTIREAIALERYSSSTSGTKRRKSKDKVKSNATPSPLQRARKPLPPRDVPAQRDRNESGLRARDRLRASAPGLPLRKQTPDNATETERAWQAHLRRTRGPKESAGLATESVWHGAQAKGWRKLTDLPFLKDKHRRARGAPRIKG